MTMGPIFNEGVLVNRFSNFRRQRSKERRRIRVLRSGDALLNGCSSAHGEFERPTNVSDSLKKRRSDGGVHTNCERSSACEILFGGGGMEVEVVAGVWR
jgi:hypothetical protein